jgi:hypothetical protein
LERGTRRIVRFIESIWRHLWKWLILPQPDEIGPINIGNDHLQDSTSDLELNLDDLCNLLDQKHTETSFIELNKNKMAIITRDLDYLINVGNSGDLGA